MKSGNWRPAFPELLEPNFWEAAFEPMAPFYDSYVKYFGRAVVEGIPEVIDVHREAIYYLKDDAVGPVICCMILIATRYPDANFVEFLTFFLNHKKNMARMEYYLMKLPINFAKELIESLDSLSGSLKDGGDVDMSDDLIPFREVLAGIINLRQRATKFTE